MKKIILTAALCLAASVASATTQGCTKKGNNYECPVGDTIYTVSGASSEAAALAAAQAKAEQAQSQTQGQVQGQNQSQSSVNDNSNSVTNSVSFKDDSVSLATPSGGGCTWGLNVGVPGKGGFGVCGTTRNATAIAAAQVADQIGNPCHADNRLAAELLLKAPLFKGVKLSCGK